MVIVAANVEDHLPSMKATLERHDKENFEKDA